MNVVFCHQCMRKHPPEEKICPVCGYEHGISSIMDNVLPPEIILDGRYLLGNMQKQDHDCIFYSALDLQNDAVVSITEYFPGDKAGRAGTAVIWTVSIDDVQNLLIGFQGRNKDKELFLENGTIYSVQKAPAEDITRIVPKKASIAVPGERGVVEIPDSVVGSLTPAHTSGQSKAGKPAKAAAVKRKAKKNSTAKIAAGAAAAVILLLGWCGGNHLRGNQAMKQEDYAKAISAYGADFLFSGKQRAQALHLAGEECFANEDYVGAAEYFKKLGADGEARWSDAVYEQALLLIREENYEEAITVLEDIASETRAAEQKGVAQLEIAKELYRSGKTDEAITLAESIENTTHADVTAFINNIYLDEADICIGNENYQGAINAYKKCQGNAEAKFNLAVFENLMGGNPYLAATSIVEDQEKGTSSYTIGDWYVIFKNVINELPAATDLNVNLNRKTAIGLLDTPVDFSDESHVNNFDIFLKGLNMIGTTKIAGDDCFVINSMDDVYSQCGTAPAGKILIVLQTHDYPDKNQSYLVSNGVMSLLPVEYRPSSLAEVEYVVMINYNYSKTGKYTKGTVAVQENAKITIYRMPDKKSVATSSSIKGDRAPNTFYYYGTPPEWYSGGAPNVSKKLIELLKKIM